MVVTLLTDYGYEAEFAGVCRGVICGIAPDAQIVDITHGIGKYDVRHGALVLANTIAYAPIGVHVAIVDPQVGTERRAWLSAATTGACSSAPTTGFSASRGRSAAG